MSAPRGLPPFNLRGLLADREGLLARLEMAFALERPHRLAPMPTREPVRAPRPKPPPDKER